MRLGVAGDSRCTITFTSGSIGDAVSTIDLEQFDLIFVDDSTSAEQRAATITALSALHPQNPWTVVHDYEVADYQRAATGFSHRFIFDAYNPATGVVFNFRNERQTDLKHLKQRLTTHSNRLEPDDIDGWLRVLSK